MRDHHHHHHDYHHHHPPTTHSPLPRYEDLLLGPSTVCRGKQAFANALAFHPAFVTSSFFDELPFTLPALRLVVDSVAEGVDAVGVEWHVEVGGGGGDEGTPFPLGRGLSQAKIDVATGKITRVVDIAEVRRRAVGRSARGLCFTPRVKNPTFTPPPTTTTV